MSNECAIVKSSDETLDVSTPVGSLKPNPFGLHDVHGNLNELVRDAFASYVHEVRPGDGEREGGKPAVRVARGGAFSSPASQARSAYRFDAGPTLHGVLGCRPARAIWD